MNREGWCVLLTVLGLAACNGSSSNVRDDGYRSDLGGNVRDECEGDVDATGYLDSADFKDSTIPDGSACDELDPGGETTREGLFDPAPDDPSVTSDPGAQDDPGGGADDDSGASWDGADTNEDEGAIDLIVRDNPASDPEFDDEVRADVHDDSPVDTLAADSSSDACQEVPFTPALCGFRYTTGLPPLQGSPPYPPDDASLLSMVDFLHERGECTGFEPGALDPTTQAVIRISEDFASLTECGFRLLKLERCPTQQGGSQYVPTDFRVMCGDSSDGDWTVGYGFLYIVPPLPRGPVYQTAANSLVYRQYDCITPTTPDEDSPCCLPFKAGQCDEMFADFPLSRGI